MSHTPGPPAFTEANRRKVDPAACACLVDDGNIIRCPLHRAAPALLAALEWALPRVNCAYLTPSQAATYREAREVIAQAKDTAQG